MKRAARSRGVSMAQFLRDAAESALRRTEPAARGPFDDLIGVIRDAPSDLAEHHDRYLYGARSKRR